MAQALSSGLGKLQENLNGSLEGKKVADMAKVTKDYHDPNAKLTTDYGVKQTNTDDWLKVSTEDKTGPSLLEDHAAREKVPIRLLLLLLIQRSLLTCSRSTDSIMSVSQNVLFTPVVLVPLVPSV